MASTYSAIACPHCGCCATEDDYYKSDEKLVWCYRCGYTFYRTIVNWVDNRAIFDETVYEGHGMLLLVKKDGEPERRILNRALTSKEMKEFSDAFLKDDVDLKKSYFVTYEDGVFTTIAGTTQEDFYLSFEEYKEKMGGKEEDLEIIVPVSSLGL